MTEDIKNHLASVILVHLVEEMGGMLVLDAEQILDRIASYEEHKLRLYIKEEKLFIELHHED